MKREIQRLKEELLRLSTQVDHLNDEVVRSMVEEDKLKDELAISKRNEEGLKRELVEAKESLTRMTTSLTTYLVLERTLVTREVLDMKTTKRSLLLRNDLLRKDLLRIPSLSRVWGR